MANYNVTITNGTGSQAMQAGTYTVVATDANGYVLTTLTPASYTATESTGTGAFTLTANGTLTFNVNETGASGGTPVTSGTMIMTDSTGTTTYGSSVAIDSSGNAVFNNVPYSTSSPITLYFKQLTTDDSHNIYSGVITVTMNAQTLTEYVQNTAIATQTITLTDGTYTNLPIASGTLSFSG